jgi:hypothetical protein
MDQYLAENPNAKAPSLAELASRPNKATKQPEGTMVINAIVDEEDPAFNKI